MGLEEHLPEVMAILYRPIVKGDDNTYTIESYNGDTKERVKQIKKMSSQQVQNALVFFYHFGRIFTKTMELFLISKLRETKKQ